MTRADKIRKMTDEELAELFDGVLDVCTHNDEHCSLPCDECWLKWLQEDTDENP